MKVQRYIYSVLALPLMGGAQDCQVKSQKPLSECPNIILIMADDLGWGDVGFNGNTHIQTPCLDKLAAEGVVFEQFYSAAPLSSPTRASVLTGRNAYRMGVFAPNVGILRPEETTLPELLKKRGYATGHFGKWHLGTLTCQEKDANRGGPTNKHLLNPPIEHGYEEAFVTESKVPTYDPMYAPLKNNGRFWDCLSDVDEKKNYGTAYWDIEGNKITEGLSGDDSRIIMDYTLPFIERAMKQDKPFLATIWLHTPHLPCVAAPEYAALYQNYPVEEKNYYGCITAMDNQIERLVLFLKEKALYDNTILLFCSDNGPELNTPGSAGNLKGKKRSLYEGGIRVPSFMVGGKVDRKGRVTQPCSTSDYLPTLAAMIGMEKEILYPLDGESILPFLESDTITRKKPLVFCSGTQGAVIRENYKLYYNNGKVELYDLCKDPTEQIDLSASQVLKVEELSKYLHQQMDEYKGSFDGTEYGKASVERMKQNWQGIR